MWDPENSIPEAEKQLNEKSVYMYVIVKTKILQGFAETSNDIIKIWKVKGKKAEKELK